MTPTETAKDRDPLDGRFMKCMDCGYVITAELIQSSRYDVGCPRCENTFERFVLTPERERGDRNINHGGYGDE